MTASGCLNQKQCGYLFTSRRASSRAFGDTLLGAAVVWAIEEGMKSFGVAGGRCEGAKESNARESNARESKGVRVNRRES